MRVAMRPASRFRVFALYQQVEVRDAADVEHPQWETGEERTLAAAQCIVLATRPDPDGPVEIEVRVGAELEHPAGQLVFDGELLTTGQGCWLAAR
jgi:hypothetical protein